MAATSPIVYPTANPEPAEFRQADGSGERATPGFVANVRCLRCGAYDHVPLEHLRAARVGRLAHAGGRDGIGPMCGGQFAALDVTLDEDGIVMVGAH